MIDSLSSYREAVYLETRFCRSDHTFRNVEQGSPLTKKANKLLLRHEVLHGGVLSPTLFLVFINDFIQEFHKGIKTSLHADDLVMWCKEEYATTATYRMQIPAVKLTALTQKWCLAINTDKYSTRLFPLSPKQKAGTIKIGKTPRKNKDDATYLGVTFDKKQNWKPQFQKAETKARRKLAIMRNIVETS